jgi:hypothetical protein
VLHQIYAKALAGQEASARDRIERAWGYQRQTPAQLDHE